jgi:hypothetical protein
MEVCTAISSVHEESVQPHLKIRACGVSRRCTAILSGNQHIELSSIVHISILQTTLETRKPYVGVAASASRISMTPNRVKFDAETA